MAQSESSTRDGTGVDKRLPSVAPADVELAKANAKKLEKANELFSSLDTDELARPENTVVERAESPRLPESKTAAARCTEDEAIIVAELDTSDEEDLGDALDQALGPKLQQQLPRPALRSAKMVRSKPRPGRKKVKKARPIFRIRTREDDPFQWKDLLTRKGLKKNASFIYSLLLHTLLILFLSFLVVRNGIGDSSLFIDMADAPGDPGEAFLEGLDINPVELNDENIEIADVPLDDLMEEVLEKEETEKDLLKESNFEADLESMAANSRQTNGRAEGDGKSATFFGTRASGRRFVFVVDRSVSMEYGSENFPSRELFNRYDVAKSELLAAIGSLKPHQEFFVVMFANDTIPMFDAASDLGESRMMAATPENISRFERWLEGVTMGYGTDPRDGLKMAVEMKPDAIFMLSDGEFVSERRDERPKTLDIVRSYAESGAVVPINTVSLVVEETVQTMKSIADMSGGNFRFTTIQQYVQQVAQLRGPMRFRAVDQLLKDSKHNWDDRYRLIREHLLPMLNDRSLAERVRGESLIHHATMGLFDRAVPSVLRENNQAVIEWTRILEEIAGYARTGQPTALGKGRELEESLFLSMLELNDGKFLDDFEKLDFDRVGALTMVEMVRAISRLHDKSGSTSQSVGWLHYLIARLKSKKPKPRSELGKVGWSPQQAQVAIDRLFEQRASKADNIYRKYSDEKTAANLRERLGKSLVRKYPETEEALRVMEEQGGLEGGNESFVSEDSTQEELFGQ